MVESLYSDDQSPRKTARFHYHRCNKTGTTSLDFYLSLHPEIHMARPKEPRFFIDAPEPLGRWHRGLDWYRGLFRSEKRICGEASPTYSNWSAKQGVFERMHSVVPDAKILFVVRERFAWMPDFAHHFSATNATIPGSTCIRTNLVERFFAIPQPGCWSKNCHTLFFTTSGMD